MSLHGDPFSGVWGRLQDSVTCVGLRVASFFFCFFLCLYALGPTGTGATGVDQPGVDCVGRLIRTCGALRAIAPVTWAATHGVSSARLSLLTGNGCLWLIMGTAPTRGCDTWKREVKGEIKGEVKREVKGEIKGEIKTSCVSCLSNCLFKIRGLHVSY